MLAAIGASSVHEVAEQAAPRADFAGLSAPNPEHESALAALRALAEQHGDDLAFAHDPDADRLAVMVRDRGALRALTGDEVGALLSEFLLAAHAPPPRAAIVSTLVSGSLAERVAEAHGATFARTPTGFKWIAARGRALERAHGLKLVLGYEEAIGYAFGALSDDKDGIAALYVLLALVRRLHAQGRTLVDALDDLVRQHGAFATRQLTVARDPAAPAGDLLARLRAIDPATLLGAGATRVDYASAPEPLDLLMIRHPSGAKLCARPSGTEPKLKLYLEAWAASDAAAVETEPVRTRAREALDLLEQRVRAI
jgi:phosphomannomutase